MGSWNIIEVADQQKHNTNNNNGSGAPLVYQQHRSTQWGWLGEKFKPTLLEREKKGITDINIKRMENSKNARTTSVPASAQIVMD